MKNIKIGPEAVLEKFGVSPDKVIDVQALAGDSSDNVPGVPGIGVKTASQLINEYGSLEKLLDNASSIKQEKRRESLLNNAELAIISKKLVSLFSEVPIPYKISDLSLKTLLAICIPMRPVTPVMTTFIFFINLR